MTHVRNFIFTPNSFSLVRSRTPSTLFRLLEREQARARTNGKINPLPISASLSGLEINQRDLSALNLSGTSFKNSKINESYFSSDVSGLSSLLVGSLFEQVSVKRLVADSVNFSGSRFNAAHISGSDFQNSNFSQASFSQSVLINSNYIKSIFLKADFKAASCFGSRFSEADFSKANFDRTIFEDTIFESDNIFLNTYFNKGGFFIGSEFDQVIFKNSIFNAVNFSDSILNKVIFQNCQITNTNFLETNPIDIVLKDCTLVSSPFANEVTMINCLKL